MTSGWGRAAIVAAIVVGVLGVGGFLTWVTATSSADPRLVDAGPLRRLGRWYRSLWLRGGAVLLGWPHMVDVLLGTSRTPVGTIPAEEIYREGTATVVRFGPDGGTGDPVLIVHALVSKPWILDLAPGHSLVGALAAAGRRVYLIDWGDAGPKDARRGLEEHALTLMRAEQEVLASAKADRLHLVGYCFGGTLCLARAAAYPDRHLASVVAIAPPVDTAINSGMTWALRTRLLRPVLALDGRGLVPRALVRESFHLLRPRAIRTVARRVFGKTTREFRRFYGALGRWVWEHRPMPGALWLDLVGLFRENALYEGSLRLGDRRCRLTAIRTPVLVAVAVEDHIVPPASSLGLASVSGLDVEVVRVPAGHVSMLAGTGGREVLYPALVRWLEQPGRPQPKG